MNKAYLRYSREAVLGQVYGSTNIELDPEGIFYTVSFLGKLCFVGANEEVLAINILEGKVVGKMHGPEDFHEQVTTLVCGKKRPILAAGYNDGTIILFDPSNFKMVQKFSFHSSAVTALTFDTDVFSCYIIH